jgi:hypothetical protein
MDKATISLKTAASCTKANGRMVTTMAKAPYTIKTAASTLANGRMTSNMAKAPYTIKTAASTLANGRMASVLSDDSVSESKQSER